MKHCCPGIPRYTQIEYDWQWKWCWTSNQVMESIEFCPYCGAKLSQPTVTHIVFFGNIVRGDGKTVFTKDTEYEVMADNGDSYVVPAADGCRQLFPKSQRGKLYKCKEVPNEIQSSIVKTHEIRG